MASDNRDYHKLFWSLTFLLQTPPCRPSPSLFRLLPPHTTGHPKGAELLPGFSPSPPPTCNSPESANQPSAREGPGPARRVYGFINPAFLRSIMAFSVRGRGFLRALLTLCGSDFGGGAPVTIPVRPGSVGSEDERKEMHPAERIPGDDMGSAPSGAQHRRIAGESRYFARINVPDL